MSKDNEANLPYREPTSSNPNPSIPPERPNKFRSELTVFIGEFVGTFLFLFLAFCGTHIAVQSDKTNPSEPESNNACQDISKLLYISFAFGAGLAINVAIFVDVSGGMFNPAATIGIAIVRGVPWIRALHAVFAQFLAGICSAFLVSAILPGPFSAATKLEHSMSIPRGLFLEMLLTAQLVLAILTLPAGASKPMYVGATLFVSEICGIYFTGGSLNPARSFGPAVVVGFDKYHWIYWLGPMLGAGVASAIYLLLKIVQR